MPIVVHGADEATINNLRLGPQVFPIVGALDIKGTFTAALKLLPETRHVVLISGPSQYERLLRSRFDKSLEIYREKLELIDLTGATKEELTTRLTQLPEKSIVLVLGLSGDRTGRRYIPIDAARELVPLSSAPVFSPNKGWLGKSRSFFSQCIARKTFLSVRLSSTYRAM